MRFDNNNIQNDHLFSLSWTVISYDGYFWTIYEYEYISKLIQHTYTAGSFIKQKWREKEKNTIVLEKKVPHNNCS